MIGSVGRILAIFSALTICLVAAGLVWGALGSSPSLGRLFPTLWDAPVSSTWGPEVFNVTPGHSAGEIGDELQRRGLIRSSLGFRWEVESRGLASKIGAGEYELSPSMSTKEIVGVLARGAVARGTTFTILEGWRAEQVARRAEELGLGSADDILRLVRSPRDAGLAPPDLGPGGLEGYLFPDTYQVDPKASSPEFVGRMVGQFERVFDESLRRQAADRGLTLNQAVTLASIIEREAAIPAERPLIASVYYNRLRAGMRLEADPTVQYAVAGIDLGLAAAYGYWKRELSRQDLQVESPYNTYRYGGLPPAPICNPGLDSLRAAVAPAASRYQFFVARGDGSHAFAETHDEHLENVRRYR